MEHITLFSALKASASAAQERGPKHLRSPYAAPVTAVAATPSTRQREEEQEDHTAVAVRLSVALPDPKGHDREMRRHTRAQGTTAITVAAESTVIPPTPGVVISAASPLPSSKEGNANDSGVSEVGSTTQHLTAGEPATAPAAPRLSSSPVDVPPCAVPASRYNDIYDGSIYFPPGTTKRALGRMRRLWCCVLTQESWHATFVAGPILFFTSIFVTVVVPPGEWFSYLYTFVFTVASLTCLTLSVTLDPGIIPPAPLSEQPCGPAMVMVDGKMVELKVCRTCHILRPPRSSHCKFCDVCVEEYDHHCGVLGSCVAKRTFRFFGGFFIITTFLAIYVFVRSFVIVVSTDFSKGNEDMHLLAVAAGCVVCILAAILGGVMVVPCAVRYVMLSARNETTKETMRRDQEAAEQLPSCVPVEEVRIDGCCKNVAQRLFSPLGRSRIPFDYYI